MTHGETFFKNIILLICVIPIFIQRKSFRRDSSVFAEWLFISIYGLIALGFSIVSYVRMPVVEFTDFKVGTDIAVELSDAAEGRNFETMFVYEKDGVKQEFSLDNLPDTTWNFVESVDVSDASDDAPFEFYVTNSQGQYVTDTLITLDTPIMICNIYDLDEFYSDENWMKVNMLKERVESEGGELWLLVASTPEETKSVLGADVEERFEVGYTDYKTAIAVHRSNGGFLYINSAFIVKKWSRQGLSPEDDLSVLSKDFDEVMIYDVIKQQLIYEISIVVLLASIAVIRYFCKMVSLKRMRMLRAESSKL